MTLFKMQIAGPGPIIFLFTRGDWKCGWLNFDVWKAKKKAKRRAEWRAGIAGSPNQI